MSSLNWTVVRNSVLVGVGILVPVSFAASALVEEPDAWLRWLFFALVLLALGAAGVAAGWGHRNAPLLHGAVAAVLAFVLAQAAALIVGVVDSSETSDDLVLVIPLLFTALIALCCGTAGALAGDWLHRRLAPNVSKASAAGTTMTSGESAG